MLMLRGGGATCVDGGLESDGDGHGDGVRVQSSLRKVLPDKRTSGQIRVVRGRGGGAWIPRREAASCHASSMTAGL